MPPANPATMLPVSWAAITEVIAAHSIMPSMPRLMMPLRWTTSSPSTASSSGVDATIASRIESITCVIPPERDQREDHHRLSECGHGRRDAGGPLQLARAACKCAEEKRRDERGARVELREQRDGDSGVAVARGESLEQPVRHA